MKRIFLNFYRSPALTKHNLALDKHFYNLTMSYRLDSDIVWSYAYMYDKAINRLVAPAKHALWREPETVNGMLTLISLNSKFNKIIMFNIMSQLLIQIQPSTYIYIFIDVECPFTFFP